VRVSTQDPHSHAWDHSPREWKAHDGPVLALAWAHPSFGNLLASGGSDGALHLWLEDPHHPPDSHHSHGHAHGHAHGHGRPPAGWHCTASLLDAHGTLRSLSFAPPEAGLKLAAVSSDSHLRVWECLDPLALRDWQLRDDVDLAALPLSPSSAAPLHGHADPRGGAAGALVGSGDGFGLASGVSAASGGSAGGASSSAGSTAAPFPSVSSASSVSGTGTGTGGGGGGGGGARAGGTVESDGAWAVSWCQEAWWGERIAVSSGTNGLIRVRRLSPSRSLRLDDVADSLIPLQLFHFPSSSSSSSSSSPWHNYLNLLPSRPFITSRAPSASSSAQPASTPTSSAFSVAGTGTSSASSDDPDAPGHYAHGAGGSHTHTPPTASLAWAPPSGRSFLLLAAGARDGRARVWKVVPPPLGAPSASSGSAASAFASADTRSSAAMAGGGAAPDEGGAGAAGEWAARLEVELDAAPPAERPGLGASGAAGAAGAAGGPGGALASARVAWNVTGTVLSTSGGDDGRVRLWKRASLSPSLSLFLTPSGSSLTRCSIARSDLHGPVAAVGGARDRGHARCGLRRSARRRLELVQRRHGPHAHPDRLESVPKQAKRRPLRARTS